MTDEERLHVITAQLIIVRDNLFRGMSKSMQKLQARAINEVLELPNFTESPQFNPLTDEQLHALFDSPLTPTGLEWARRIEAAHGIK